MDAFILGATVTALGLTAKYIWFAKNSDSLIDALNEVVDNVDDVNVIGLCRSYKKFLTSYCRSVSKVIIEIDELKTSRKEGTVAQQSNICQITITANLEILKNLSNDLENAESKLLSEIVTVTTTRKLNEKIRKNFAEELVKSIKVVTLM